MRNVGVFGGTFNPPHIAHKRLALEAAEKAKLDKVFVIPTYTPPHKIAKNLLSGDDRIELCRRTFYEDIFEISDIELKREGKSYTVDTVKQLLSELENTKLFLIIGSDMLLTFHEWFHYEEILKSVTLIVISRENEIDRNILKAYAENTLNLKEENGDIIILDLPPEVLSSTQIRELIEKGEPTEGMLTEKAEEYIAEKGFYR